MIKTKLIVPGAVAAAVGGFAIFESQTPNGSATNSAVVDLEATQRAIALSQTPPELETFPQLMRFEEVFRFDVYPNWVKSRWQRVSTAPSDSGLSGMRVPLVTGISDSDLAGSLTYFFDDTHRVQKIEFSGVTNDATRLVSFLQQNFKFQSQKSLDAGLYLSGRRSNPTGVAQFSHPTIVNAEQNGQIQVYFEIKAAGSPFSLGQRTQWLLRQPQDRR